MLNIIIFGPPGAGKGTQAALIAKNYGLTHLSSGEILRREIKDGELGDQIKKYQAAGKLVPDRLIIEIMENVLTLNIKKAGFILDGYPRNLRQAKELDRFLKTNGHSIDLVLNLKLNEKQATERIIERGRLSGRSDDNHQTVKIRFEVYREETVPLLNYYKDQDKVINIDGRPKIEAVFESIQKTISTL